MSFPDDRAASSTAVADLDSPGVDGAGAGSAGPTRLEHFGHIRAMATDVTVKVPNGAHDRGVIEAVESALAVFRKVEVTCTRFDPQSPLMRANGSPERWHVVPSECYAAIAAASSAYARTKGVFDPRILTDLVDLGYDGSLRFSEGDVSVNRDIAGRRQALGPWRPRFRASTSEVLIGAHPIDLGGIGKGLAIAWASAKLASIAPDHLIEAGGDCYCAGLSGERKPWRIGIEDPRGSRDPMAVLALRDRACTTSSVRVRRWNAGGRPVHHLLDASTGRPGGDGLLSVTVVGDEPDLSEVLSKTLFLGGATRIATAAKRRGLAAVWVTTAGDLAYSKAAQRYLLWKR